MENNKLNFAFWGTPEVAKETLEILKQNGFLPSLIVTAPDKPQGRKMIITPPPVKVWAIENKIPFIQPENLSSKDLLLAGVSQADGPRGSAVPVGTDSDPIKVEPLLDLSIVVAYGKILSEEILNLPKFGSINVHYSLLPKYRGASPVESAILNGEKETGVTIQKMAFKLDSGPIIAQEKTEVGETETAPELKKRLIKIGANLLIKVLNTPSFFLPLAKGEVPKAEGVRLIQQDEAKATYCKKIKKEDGLIDLATGSPSELYNKFRAYAGWPRTFFFKDGKRYIITKATLENGVFTVKRVIPEGKKETDYRE